MPVMGVGELVTVGVTAVVAVGEGSGVAGGVVGVGERDVAVSASEGVAEAGTIAAVTVGVNAAAMRVSCWLILTVEASVGMGLSLEKIVLEPVTVQPLLVKKRNTPSKRMMATVNGVTNIFLMMAPHMLNLFYFSIFARHNGDS